MNLNGRSILYGEECNWKRNDKRVQAAKGEGDAPCAIQICTENRNGFYSKNKSSGAGLEFATVLFDIRLKHIATYCTTNTLRNKVRIACRRSECRMSDHREPRVSRFEFV